MSNWKNEVSAGSGYRLVDFGDGRKLEWFGGRLLDRPSLAAEGVGKLRPDLWKHSSSVFHTGGGWQHRAAWDQTLRVEFEGFNMPIAPTPFGHVGVFPEQADNWRWLMETAPATVNPDPAAPANPDQAPSGLNLFAYTGASSIAMATSGLRVAHVDAAKQNVTAARAAAALNGLQEHPIRYLVDDAAKFVARENRRGNRYHTIILDPPAYGHSPGGRAWRLERDLWTLIDACLAILTPSHGRLLITGHSPQVGPRDVVDYLDSLDQLPAGVQRGRMALLDLAGRKLDAGFFVRCCF